MNGYLLAFFIFAVLIVVLFWFSEKDIEELGVYELPLLNTDISSLDFVSPQEQDYLTTINGFKKLLSEPIKD